MADTPRRRGGGLMSRLSPGNLYEAFTRSQIYRSVIRNPWPNNARTRALAVMNSVFLHLQPTRTRPEAIKITYTWGLGGISFLFFLLLTITGVLLMFYYVPTVPGAYTYMKELQGTVSFGQLMRNVHRWAAHGMVIVVFLHMCRVFYTGSYRPPREFNWVVGVVLLFCTFFLSYTGYLLPWDQLSFWAVTVGANMAGATPFLGELVSLLLLGDKSVGQATLVRFYTLHVIAMPLLTALFLSVHFWRIRKDGFSRGL